MAFRYHGILGKRRRHDPLPDGEAERSAWIEQDKAETLKRWRALFEAHGVEWGNESELLQRMAEAHVPGFNARKPPGPKVVWTEGMKLELRVAVDEFVADRRRQGKKETAESACAKLAKLDHWAKRLRKNSRDPAEALRGHYNTANALWANIVRDMRAEVALAIQQPAAHRGLSVVVRYPRRRTSRKLG
jgi:hypothetical protein